VGALLIAAGIAFGYLLAQDTTDAVPAADAGLTDVVTSLAAQPVPVAASEPARRESVRFFGTIVASVEFGRGLVTWSGDRDPVKVRLAADAESAAYNAAQSRIAVTFPEYVGDRLSLHVGTPGDLRFVTSGVTGFAWHPTDPGAIAWVEETESGFAIVEAAVTDVEVTPSPIVVLPDETELVAWGSWGYALQGRDGLTTVNPSGEVIATSDIQLVTAGSDGRLIVARPAGTPLSSDWAITWPDLAGQQPLGRFDDADEHPTAAAILPVSGRIVLVSNRFGEGTDLAKIEILSADGDRELIIRSGMIADSIVWSSDQSRLAVGGYYNRSNQLPSVVLLAATDGSGQPIEVPFDGQVRPLALRD
jgi:hypothetical protein